MGDSSSSRQCVGDVCYDVPLKTEGRDSGQILPLLKWTSEDQKIAQQGQQCRLVNGQMVCELQIEDKSAKLSTPRGLQTADSQNPAKLDSTAPASDSNKPTGDSTKPASDATQKAVPASDANQNIFEMYPWMVPPQLSDRYVANAQSLLNASRVSDQQVLPQYYSAQDKAQVYKGPSTEAAPAEKQIASKFDPYSFHQGALDNVPATKAVESRPVVAPVSDPFSYHQGPGRDQTTPPAPAKVIATPEIRQAEVQQPQQLRNCTPDGGCPQTRQNQYNPCRPCRPCQPNGGWYPGKLVGRVFGRRCR